MNIAHHHNTDPYRVMVVDDSAVIRGLLSRTLEKDSDIRVAASVSDGQMAIDYLKRHPVEVIVLDIEMAGMDGLTALPLLLQACPGVRVIMASTLTQKNAEVSLKAMQLGASDYLAKPSSSKDLMGVNDFNQELVLKVKALGNAARRAMGVVQVVDRTVAEPVLAKAPIALRPMPVLAKFNAIAIGSSTGGPQALFEVLKNFSDLSVPIFLTQHMPATFTAILADHIQRQCNVNAQEGKQGEAVKAGCLYVAPGGYHMVPVRHDNDVVIELNEDPPENFCRPAVDPMLRGLTKIYGRNLLTIILTGMGNDGQKGAQEAVNNGGVVIAQNEKTSIVWGMPGAVAQAGICSAVLPLDEIGPHVRQLIRRAGMSS